MFVREICPEKSGVEVGYFEGRMVKKGMSCVETRR